MTLMMMASSAAQLPWLDLSAQQGMQVAAEEMVRLTRWQVLLGWLTAAGLAFTLAVNLSALRQTRESLDLARATAEAQLKPYISIFMGGVTRVELGQQPKPTIRVLNTGQTPAMNVSVVMDSELVPARPDIPFRPDFSEPFLVNLDIAPQRERRAHAPLHRPLTQSDLDGLKALKLCLHVWGTVSFDDQFGMRTVMDFAHTYYGEKCTERRSNKSGNGVRSCSRVPIG